jgi:hypothetical protein
MNQSSCQLVEVAELRIQDRYVNRKMMHLFKLQMIGKQVIVGNRVSSVESTDIQAIIFSLKDSNGNNLDSGQIVEATRIVFRSKSARIFLLIQISQEMWNPISGTCFLPIEILMYKFLPQYFGKMKEESCTHSISVVLFSRCWVKDSWEFYDFLSTVLHNENSENLLGQLQKIRNEIVQFKEQVLKECPDGAYLSNSYDGNWLEANNLAVNLFDRHNLSRDFTRTGLSVVTLTAGQCVFLVEQKLCQFLKFKTAHNGIFLHIVAFALPPLFAVPNLRFLSANNDWIVPHWFNCSFFIGDESIELARCLRMPQPKFIKTDFSSRNLDVERKEFVFVKMRSLSIHDSENSSFSASSASGSESRRLLHQSFSPSSNSENSFYSNHSKLGSFCRKWLGINPQTIDQIHHSIITDWDSLLTPPSLPIETDYFPSDEELNSNFKKYSYSLIPTDYSSFCKKENVFELLVEQRLLQGFQLIMQRCIPKKVYYLSVGTEIHVIQNNTSDQGSICIERYVSQELYLEHSSKISVTEYEIFIKIDKIYNKKRLKFSNPTMLSIFNWNYFDYFISGYNTSISESLKYWSKRFVLVPVEKVCRSSNLFINPSGENLSQEEYRIAGFFKFIHFLQNWRLNPSGALPPYELDKQLTPGTFISVFVLSDSLEDYLEKKQYMNDYERGDAQSPLRKVKLTKEAPLEEISAALFDSTTGPPIRDAKWHFRSYKGIVLGSDIVDWMMRNVQNIKSRQEAVEFGVYLMKNGLLEHYSKRHSFLDGFYYYKLLPYNARDIEIQRKASFQNPLAISNVFGNEPVALSKAFLVNTDIHGKNSRIEWAVMHYDSVYSYSGAFSFHLHWLTCNPNLLEETLKCWARKALQCGFYFYETPVLPNNPNSPLDLFTYVLCVQLAVLPPKEDENLQVQMLYFDAIMKKFHFHLDFEPDERLVKERIASWSFEKTPCAYRQYIHVSGGYFALISSINQPFHLMKNNLKTNYVTTLTNFGSRLEFNVDEFIQFCNSPSQLTQFYKEVQESSKLHVKRFIFH